MVIFFTRLYCSILLDWQTFLLCELERHLIRNLLRNAILKVICFHGPLRGTFCFQTSSRRCEIFIIHRQWNTLASTPGKNGFLIEAVVGPDPFNIVFVLFDKLGLRSHTRHAVSILIWLKDSNAFIWFRSTEL